LRHNDLGDPPPRWLIAMAQRGQADARSAVIIGIERQKQLPLGNGGLALA
jgi:hypothetical protein